MTLPFEITTFASNSETLKTAISAGATHIIIEDSKLSVRSFSNDFETDNFDKVNLLAKHARELDKNIKLSFNLDILVHEEHFEAINSLLETLNDVNIYRVRIQDVGLIPVLKDKIKNVEICLATETGNNNAQSSSFFKESGVTRQSFGNELPKSEIKIISEKVDSEFELQVHGRVLLQYSRRQLLSNIFHDNKGPIRKYGKDVTRPEHCFTLYENTHGHFTYHSLDKSLITEIQTLMDLNLTSWLIDTRGENSSYLKAAIDSYRNEAISFFKGNYRLNPNTLEKLKTVSPRKLSALFFDHNPTNQTGPQVKKVINDRLVGKTVDIIKPKSMVLKLTSALKKGDSIELLTPDGRVLTTTLHSIRTIWDENIENSHGHTLIKLPWLKGAVPQSLVVKL
jgi:putative protease